MVEAIWLFEVTDTSSNIYYWSIAETTFDTQDYSAKVVEFKGITLNRQKAENTMVVPNETTITISNPNNSFASTDFENGTCLIKQVIDGNIQASYKFNIKRAYNQYQKLYLNLQDFLTSKLEGTWPNTPLINDLFPSSSLKSKEDNMCIPIPFGTCYIPTRPVNLGGDVYYILGPDNYTYTIEECRPPRESGLADKPTPTTYASADYSFPIISNAGYKLYQPIVVDTDDDGTADATGVYYDNGVIHDFLTKYSRSDTSGLTNPAHIIEYILKDFGLLDGEISGIGDAAITFDDWGLEWNGAFYYKQSRKQIISTLLNMCNATLDVGETVALRVLDTTSQATVNKSKTKKQSFKYDAVTIKETDSGYIAFNDTGAQDKLIKALVSGGGGTTNPSNDTLQLPLVQNSDHAQRLGVLAYQRLYYKKARVSFDAVFATKEEFETSNNETFITADGDTFFASGFPYLLPGKVITIDDPDYNGTFNALIDKITYNKDFSVSIDAVAYSISLDNWRDIVPATLTVDSSDNTTKFKPTISGPDSSPSSGDVPNVLPGRLRVGQTSNYILLDSEKPIIKLDESGQDRLRIGDLGTNNYGIQLLDAGGNSIVKIDDNSNLLSGWDLTSTTISKNNILLDSAGKIQIGSGLSNNVSFNVKDKLYWDDTNSLLNVEGKITATSGELQTLSVTDQITISSEGSLVAGDATLNDTGISGTGYNLDSGGLSMTSGSININSGTFKVETDGSLTATSANITGSITSESGKIGGWAINAHSLTSNSSATGIQDSTNTYAFYAGNSTVSSAPFRVNHDGSLVASSATITGSITATSGELQSLSVTDQITVSTGGSILAGTDGDNRVEVTNTGLAGYGQVGGVLTKTFDLPVDGSAPTFSSGTIKEAEYQIYTSGIIKTNSDPTTNGGLQISNTLLQGFNDSGKKLLKFVYQGTDQGDAYIGDIDSSNNGFKYDHSTGDLKLSGEVYQIDNKWRLNNDGSGQLAGGNISWDDLGNAIFKGTLTAGTVASDVLSSLNADIGTVTAGKLQSTDNNTLFDLDNNKLVFNGKDTYGDDATNGIFLGEDSGAYKLNIGDANNALKYNGSTLTMYLKDNPGNSKGVIFKGGSRWLYDFNPKDNGTVKPDGNNLFLGKNAGNFTMGDNATETYHSSENVGIGIEVLFSNDTGFENIGMGDRALYNNFSGNANIALGSQSLYSNNSGTANIGIGSETLTSCVGGNFNIAIGTNSLFSNDSGESNIGIGTGSLHDNTSGYANIAMGKDALYSNTSNYNNIAIGNEALYNNDTFDNIAIGLSALRNITSGNSNVAIGIEAGTYVYDGLTSNTNGYRSIFIGSQSKVNADYEDNQIVIGYDAIGNGSNTVTLGNTSITDTHLRGAIHREALSSDPDDPLSNYHVIWQSDGTGSGADGDIMMKIRNNNGTIKTVTLVDFSAG